MHLPPICLPQKAPLPNRLPLIRVPNLPLIHTFQVCHPALLKRLCPRHLLLIPLTLVLLPLVNVLLNSLLPNGRPPIPPLQLHLPALALPTAHRHLVRLSRENCLLNQLLLVQQTNRPPIPPPQVHQPVLLTRQHLMHRLLIPLTLVLLPLVNVLLNSLLPNGRLPIPPLQLHLPALALPTAHRHLVRLSRENCLLNRLLLIRLPNLPPMPLLQVYQRALLTRRHPMHLLQMPRTLIHLPLVNVLLNSLLPNRRPPIPPLQVRQPVLLTCLHPVHLPLIHLFLANVLLESLLPNRVPPIPPHQVHLSALGLPTAHRYLARMSR